MTQRETPGEGQKQTKRPIKDKETEEETEEEAGTNFNKTPPILSTPSCNNTDSESDEEWRPSFPIDAMEAVPGQERQRRTLSLKQRHLTSEESPEHSEAVSTKDSTQDKAPTSPVDGQQQLKSKKALQFGEKPSFQTMLQIVKTTLLQLTEDANEFCIDDLSAARIFVE